MVQPLRREACSQCGFLVGHSTLRRAVMGADCLEDEATEEQLASMVAMLHGALEAGALGWSSSRDDASRDGEGHLVPARAGRLNTNCSHLQRY